MKLSELEAAARAALAHSENIGEERWYSVGEVAAFANHGANGMVVVAPADDAHIANCSPENILAMAAVVRAAKVYYSRYAQDEAGDGDYAGNGMPGHYTGCSEQQALDARALREALKGIE